MTDIRIWWAGLFARAPAVSPATPAAWDVSPETMAKLRESIVPLRPVLVLRDVLARDYPNECRNLPIMGGWGASQEQAITFVRPLFPDPEAPQFIPLEYLIAAKIVDEELVRMRIGTPRFYDYSMQLKSQSHHEQGCPGNDSL